MTEYALLTSVVITLFSLSVALYFDLRYQRIPNLLCLLTFLLGITVNSYFHSWDGLLEALSGAGLAILLLIPAYYFKILGAGDVKLMIGIGTLAGPLVLTWSIAYGVIFGAFTSILIATKAVGWRGFTMMISRYIDCLYLRTYFKPEKGDAGRVNVPYAPALMLGWMLATYINHDIYDLMWTIEVIINEISTSFNRI
ncbi:MAG: prepilin peptidase [Moritella sp.]|uniref:A24 family peptidase n=1 Tax=Moritella sp. TaxID=78556 RepID=UPI001DB5F61C|nr:A24 family peptidase [Moritella sp.]NQZ50004.1 prepilin peptidase [Moritella sp.]